MNLRERLIDPQSPERKPRRAAYALPTFFTAGNIFLGFYSIMESFRGAMETAIGQRWSGAHTSPRQQRHRLGGSSRRPRMAASRA